MQEAQKEERLIRGLVILTISGALASALVAAVAVTALVSANFNVLQWME